MTLEIESLLPAALRPAGTAVHPVSQGQSGAAVYRLEGPAGHFVVKQTDLAEPAAAWARQVAMQRAAAAVGVAPRVVHADAEARVVVSEHIEDRGWPAYFGAPATQEAAMALLGEAIRHLHALPLPADLPPATAHTFLRTVWQRARGLDMLPSWVEETLVALHDGPVPASDRAPVVSHNDLNPSNLRFDGTRLRFLDWQTVSANDPYYDLALVSVFQRLDAAACRQLLTAYAGAPIRTLPPRFVWSRRFAAALSGTALLWVAGVRGARGHAITVVQAPTLLDVYTAMRDGTLSMDTGEGQWRLGLALHRVAHDVAWPEGAPLSPRSP